MYLNLSVHPEPLTLPQGTDFRAAARFTENLHLARQAIESYRPGGNLFDGAPDAINRLFAGMMTLLAKYDRGEAAGDLATAKMVHKGLHIVSALNNFLLCVDPTNGLGRPTLPFTTKDLREIRRDPIRFEQLRSYTLSQCEEAPAVYQALT